MATALVSCSLSMSQVNGAFKSLLKDKFTEWYSNKLCEALKANPDDVMGAASRVHPDLRLSVLKPLHARWVIESFAKLQLQVKTLLHGWREPGILEAVYAATCPANKKAPPANTASGSSASSNTTTSISTANSSTTTSCSSSFANTTISSSASNSSTTTVTSASSSNTSLSTTTTVTNASSSSSSSSSSTRASAPIPSLRMQTTSCGFSRFIEFYLPADVSQSRLDGRNGSTACTVIASVIAQKVLAGNMTLPVPGGEPDFDCRQQFVDCIREGNQLYDRDAAHFGLLAVYHVLDLWPELNLRPVRGYDLGWHDTKEGIAKCVAFLQENLHATDVQVGVLVQRPYSVAVVIGKGRAIVFDSHSHDEVGRKRGALLAVADKNTTAEEVASYLVGFPTRTFRISIQDTHFCLLELKSTCSP